MRGWIAAIFALGSLGAHAISFEGADIPHGVGMRHMSAAQKCAARLMRAEARRVEVTVRVFLDPAMANGKQGVDQFFPELQANGFSVWGWQRGRWFVEGTIAESKLRKLSRLKFVRFIDRFDDFAWTDARSKMDRPLRDALKDKSDRLFRMRLRVALDRDGTQFAFGELVKKLSSLPGGCQVLEVVRPKRGVPGMIVFQAGTAWAARVIEYLPGGPERSWAELDTIEN